MDIGSKIHDLIDSGNYEDLQSLLTYLKSPEFNSSYISVDDIVNQRNKKKYTPLHEAIFHRSFLALKSLVVCNADVNMKCHGTPPLHLLLTISQLPDGIEFSNNAISCFIGTGNLSIDAKDDQGKSALHLAAEYNNLFAMDKILESVNEQPDTNTIINAKDRTGYVAIHYAAMRDHVDSLKKLLEAGADIMFTNSMQYNILHFAVSCSSVDVWALLSKHEKYAELIGMRDIFGRTPIALAVLIGFNAQTLYENHVLVCSSSNVASLTGIVSDAACLNHHTCIPSEASTPSAPPENIHRIEVLIDHSDGVLHSSEMKEKLLFVDECNEATISDILRVHEWPYLRRVQAKCESLDHHAEDENGIGYLDGDTTVSRGSFNAALKSAGAVCHGVNMIMKKQAKNVFCPIRPPGHHAGPRGVVKLKQGGPDSHGFCLVNNISIGAAYAMNMYRDTIKRVAIVDFDVHHGNGTEETVRWLQQGLEEVDIVNDLFFGKISAPRFKPWFSFDDDKNVFFVSVHGYGPRESGLEHLMPRVAFYPGSGQTSMPTISSSSTQPKRSDKNSHSKNVSTNDDHQDGDDDDDDDDVVEAKMHSSNNSTNSSNDADEDGDKEDGSGSDSECDDDDYDEEMMEEMQVVEEGVDGVADLQRVYADTTHDHHEPLILDVGVQLPSQELSPSEYRHIWRNYFRNEIFPRLDAFKPDIIFISAGFDAHKKDTINAGYIALVEEDYDWITTHLVRIANTHCDGRIVSALEGGYQLGGECCSAFAKSVKAHVAALNNGGANRLPYSQRDLDIETAHERRLLDAVEAKRLQKEAQNIALRHSLQEQAMLASSHGNGTSTTTQADDANDNAPKRRRTQVDYAALDRELRTQTPT